MNNLAYLGSKIKVFKKLIFHITFVRKTWYETAGFKCLNYTALHFIKNNRLVL